jgi:threonine/homoserine/homoserine lactone efflux protein
MLLAVGRGLGQGRRAAAASALGTAGGIACHTVLVAFGLTALLQASATAFTVLKMAGAAYLVWLGLRAIRSNALIRLAPTERQPLSHVLAAGWWANLLNPKVAVFVLAFVPQFVDAAAQPAQARAQILGLGAIFAGLTVVLYAALGAAASRLRPQLLARPAWVRGLNRGAGAVLVAAGLGVLAWRTR